MAKLMPQTFPTDSAGQALLKNVKRALTNLTGVGDNPSNIYLPAPLKLNAERDNLRSDYRSIWQACDIKFEMEQTGAEMAAERQMEIGPYFLRSSTTVTDMEKIILHEFLHDALEPSGIGGSTGYEFDHTRINEIIRDNLKYPGPPNPANPSED